MSTPETPPIDVRPRPEADEREAPSSIINACHSQAKWHFLAGVFILPLVAVVPWTLYQLAERVRLLAKANGKDPGINPDWIAAFGGACGLFALINALFLFRCSNGLRAFASSRRIVALHRAMRRLRMVWRIFSVTLALAVFTVAAAIIREMFTGPR